MTNRESQAADYARECSPSVAAWALVRNGVVVATASLVGVQHLKQFVTDEQKIVPLYFQPGGMMGAQEAVMSIAADRALAGLKAVHLAVSQKAMLDPQRWAAHQIAVEEAMSLIESLDKEAAELRRDAEKPGQ